MKSIRLLVVMLALACSVVVTPGRNFSAFADEHIKSEYRLSSTGFHEHAKGTIKIDSTVDHGDIEKQTLNIKIENLASSATYVVFMDGVEAASFETNHSGDAKVDVSTKFKGRSTIRPVAFSREGIIEVRALDGTVVLTSFRR